MKVPDTGETSPQIFPDEPGNEKSRPVNEVGRMTEKL
jgi:hypothetical protein